MITGIEKGMSFINVDLSFCVCKSDIDMRGKCERVYLIYCRVSSCLKFSH